MPTIRKITTDLPPYGPGDYSQYFVTGYEGEGSLKVYYTAVSLCSLKPSRIPQAKDTAPAKGSEP